MKIRLGLGDSYEVYEWPADIDVPEGEPMWFGSRVYDLPDELVAAWRQARDEFNQVEKDMKQAMIGQEQAAEAAELLAWSIDKRQETR